MPGVHRALRRAPAPPQQTSNNPLSWCIWQPELRVLALLEVQDDSLFGEGTWALSRAEFMGFLPLRRWKHLSRHCQHKGYQKDQPCFPCRRCAHYQLVMVQSLNTVTYFWSQHNIYPYLQKKSSWPFEVDSSGTVTGWCTHLLAVGVFQEGGSCSGCSPVGLKVNFYRHVALATIAGGTSIS